MEAQENFQKIYLFQDTFAIFNDVYVTDSCYYYTCGSGANSRQNFNFGKISLSGVEDILLLDIDPTSLQKIMFSNADMDTNFRGNFVTNYVNYSTTGSAPRLKEITLNGDIVSDIILSNYWNNDSLDFINERCRIIINDIDSTYFLIHSYHDKTTDNNAGEDNGSSGVLLIKLKYDGTIIWDEKFAYSPIGLYNPMWTFPNLLRINSDELLLVINEIKVYGPSQDELEWIKTHFIKIDESGVEIDHKTFQDGQYCPGGRTAVYLSNGDIIYSYYESILGGVPPNTDYFMPRPVIARLNNNYNIVWKKTLREIYGSDFDEFDNMNDIKIIQDTLFVGGYQYYENSNENSITSLRLSQYSVDGNSKWNRDYNYFPYDFFNDPAYSINDFELTNDGGYIMAGQAFVYDSLIANKPCQYGYILKTNCLGFLGSPESSFSYTLGSDHKVQFVNESLQAGSYVWCFGDGDTLKTGEEIDTIYHTYLTTEGTFEGKLIALGCNGEADTSYFTITLTAPPVDTTILNGNYFTIYPNPAEVNGSFSVYLGNVTGEKVQLFLYDEIGQLVQKYNLDSPNTTYIIQSNFSSGLYTLSLFDDGKLIEVEKLIIE